MKKPSAQEKPLPTQGYRIWNFRALGRGRRLGFRHLWSSLGRRDAFVRRKLGRRGSNAIALPGPLHGVDVDLTEAVAILVARVLPASVADRLVRIAPGWQ